MSFATILFADGKEELLNINCKNINFLHCIRVKCSEVCTAADQIDVADETGECKFLFKNLDSYTSQYVAEREKLILLRVEEPKQGEKFLYNVKFIPLLKSLEDDKDFIVAINPTTSQKSKATKLNPKLQTTKKPTGPGGGTTLTPGGTTGAAISPSASLTFSGTITPANNTGKRSSIK